MRALILISLCALAGLAAGCGGSDGGAAKTTEPAELTAELDVPSELDELARSERVLDPVGLSADAIEPGPLQTALEEGEYLSGREVEWTGRTDHFNHVVVRTLAFEGEGGDEYLAWLEEHADDLLGSVGLRKELSLGTGGVLYRDAGCACHSDLPTFLAAWRDGTLVQTVLADGPGVDRERFLDLAQQIG